MKNVTPFVLLTIFSVLVFFAGRCTGGGKSVITETIVKTDTVIQEKLIEVKPLPAPVKEPIKLIYYVKDKKAADSLQTLLSKQIEYYTEVVSQKEKSIADLKTKVEGIGVGFPVGEDQKANVYYVEETDSLGVRLQGRISVLGEIDDQEPPMFSLTYPEVFRSEKQTIDRTKPRAIGVSLDIVGQFNNLSPDYRLGAYYRKNRIHYGANWQIREKVAALTIGTEFGW